MIMTDVSPVANVTEDIQLLSQLTPRIRTYGSDCNVTALVLQAIKDTKGWFTTIAS